MLPCCRIIMRNPILHNGKKRIFAIINNRRNMTTLTLIEKQRLINHVQQNSHSRSIIYTIIKAITEFDNISLEDFKPPVLPRHIYARLVEEYSLQHRAHGRTSCHTSIPPVAAQRMSYIDLGADGCLAPKSSSENCSMQSEPTPVSYTPGTPSSTPDKHKDTNRLSSFFRWFRHIFNKRPEYNDVMASVFAPAEIGRRSYMITQVYIHLPEETEKVKALATEPQNGTERRDYIPLQWKLKKGDKVDVRLIIRGEGTVYMDEIKRVEWKGSFTKCSFQYFVKDDTGIRELHSTILLSVNGIPIGEMMFCSEITYFPRVIHPKVITHKYSKVFISYSHKDEASVKSFHEGLELAGIDHFYDRKYLKTGDIFPLVIQDYINSADLFVLFWSENAMNSEYVRKELEQALNRAFPKVSPPHTAKLSIYPMSIEPRAELPSSMKDHYHFCEI